ncbi:MAG: DUF2283 domain-containing protein [Armatimonadetes bacterium]|nr:DUF2283 domain-containing protein [Armatimonadota bacterium]
MKITFDPRYNIAYLRFLEKREQVETIRINDELDIDIAPDGALYGIELLDANEQLKVNEEASLTYINEALGEEQTIRLAG